MLIIQLKKIISYLSYEMLILNWNQGKKDEHWKMCEAVLLWNMRHFQFHVQHLLPDRKPTYLNQTCHISIPQSKFLIGTTTTTQN